MTSCFDRDGRTWISIRVVPRASRNEVCGEMNGSVKIRLTAPPVDGKANAALADFLAETLDLPPSAIRIERGDTGRNKVVSAAGITAAAAARALGIG